MPDVIGVGDLALDLVLEIDKIPGTDSFVPMLDSSMQGGGKVPTALVALSRLGVSAGLAASVGDDRYGRFCVDELKRSGVDVSHMKVQKDTPTNLCVCLAEQSTGGRSFIGRLGAVRPLMAEELEEAYIKQASWLHVWQMNPAARQAAVWMRESGGQVVIDADRYNREIEENLGLVDVFIGSEFFYREMFPDWETKREDIGRALVSITARGPRIAIFTLGKEGLLGRCGEETFYVPAFTNITVKDTTGAGDVFHGAYICGLIKGMAAREAGRFASAVSAIKCTELGGRAGIPDYDSVLHFMETGEIDRTYMLPWIEYYRRAFYEG